MRDLTAELIEMRKLRQMFNVLTTTLHFPTSSGFHSSDELNVTGNLLGAEER